MRNRLSKNLTVAFGFLLFIGASVGLSETCLSDVTTVSDFSGLSWATLLSDKRSAAVQKQLDRVFQVAATSVDIVYEPVKVFYLEGTIFNDPKHIESDKAKATFPNLFYLAVAARIAPEPLKTRSLEKVRLALLAWSKTYEPTGNPVNEGFFLPLFQAVDLALPLLKADEQVQLRSWMKDFAVRADLFYATLSSTDTRRFNNWMAWSLAIRGVASEISGDLGLQSRTRELLKSFLAKNINQDGSTFDFIQRDAFHYHIFDLLPLVQLALFTKSIINPDEMSAVSRALVFIKPYFLGQKQHREWAHTQVKFDSVRRDAGDPDFQIKPWNPVDARNLFRLARPIFPAIQHWTENVVDQNYDPRTKLLAAIFGEESTPH